MPNLFSTFAEPFSDEGTFYNAHTHINQAKSLAVENVYSHGGSAGFDLESTRQSQRGEVRVLLAF